MPLTATQSSRVWRSHHPVVGADVDQDQGVGVVPAGFGVTRVQLVEQLLGQLVALLVLRESRPISRMFIAPPLERSPSPRAREMVIPPSSPCASQYARPVANTTNTETARSPRARRCARCDGPPGGGRGGCCPRRPPGQAALDA